MKKNNKNRVYVLDDLRGIAILLVVFFHYCIHRPLSEGEVISSFTESLREGNDYFNLGGFAVSLFFLISGFVIPMSLNGDDKKKVVKKFAIKRFFRLFPTYWFAIIFIAGIILYFKDANAFTLKQILINFTMMQDFLKQKSIDGVFWTLMVELKFYILTAILFFFGALKDIKYVMFFFFAYSMLTLFLGYLDGVKGYFNFTISYLFLMYLGTSFYMHYKNQLTKKDLMLMIFIVVLYFIINPFFAHSRGEDSLIGYSVGTIVAVGIFTYFINFKRPISKITTFFGNISYSFYLLHQVLGYLFINLLVSYSIYLPLAQFITFLMATLLAVLVYRYVETPTNKIGHYYANLATK